MPTARYALFLAGLFGLTGIAMGAFGAHALKSKLELLGHVSSWETGARHHLIHAVALLGLASASAQVANARLIANCWLVGIVFFSGSLYWIALGGPWWLGPVTPIGGIAFMVGWLSLIISAIRRT
ncbi:MAG: DUF423 domain-containing protein [Opitutaceae bacterium]|nr:DUF423 domain-containing protein [Opitutaceae bacterium]